jgi:hypothetical protein
MALRATEGQVEHAAAQDAIGKRRDTSCFARECPAEEIGPGRHASARQAGKSRTCDLRVEHALHGSDRSRNGSYPDCRRSYLGQSDAPEAGVPIKDLLQTQFD